MATLLPSTSLSSTTTPARQQQQQASSSSAQAASGGGGDAGKKHPVDALSASLRNSKLSEDPLTELEPQAFKKLLLSQSSMANGLNSAETEKIPEHSSSSSSSSSPSTEKPSLSTLLHDRIWAQGGELVMQIGDVKEVDEDGKPVPRKVFENVELVNAEFSGEELQRAIANVQQACKEADCESVVLFESSGTSKGNHAFLMLRRVPSGAQELLELRVAVIGNGE
jgi:hypothetical protein